MCGHHYIAAVGAAICAAATYLSLLVPAWGQTVHFEGGPCGDAGASCSFPDNASDAHNHGNTYISATAKPLRVVSMQLMTSHGGPLAHRWLQVESSQGEVTIGYGPASLPFIDFGQISIFDAQGNIERVGGVHLPFIDFNYAKPPGEGHPIGKPIPLTIAEADAFLEKQRHRKFSGLYVPIFHDCHTWVCTVRASLQGKSTLPCYLFFKGYR